MRVRKKKKKKRDKNKPGGVPWKESVGRALIEVPKFEIDGNPHGFKIVQELIVDWLLDTEGKTQLEKYELFKPWLKKVKQNLDAAIRYVENDCSTPVYRSVSGSKITCITTDPDYKSVKKRDYEREIKLVQDRIEPSKENVERRHPDNLLNMKSKVIELVSDREEDNGLQGVGEIEVVDDDETVRK